MIVIILQTIVSDLLSLLYFRLSPQTRLIFVELVSDFMDNMRQSFASINEHIKTTRRVYWGIRKGP